MKQSTVTKIAAGSAVALTLLAGVAVAGNIQATNQTLEAAQVREQTIVASDAIAESSQLLTNSVRAFTATGDRA